MGIGDSAGYSVNAMRNFYALSSVGISMDAATWNMKAAQHAADIIRYTSFGGGTWRELWIRGVEIAHRIESLSGERMWQNMLPGGLGGHVAFGAGQVGYYSAWSHEGSYSICD